MTIADEAGISDKRIYVMQIEPEHANTDIPIEKLNNMTQQLVNEYPSAAEGWTDIVKEASIIYDKGQTKTLHKNENPDWGDER